MLKKYFNATGNVLILQNLKKMRKTHIYFSDNFFKNNRFFKMLFLVFYFRLLLSIWPGILKPQSFNCLSVSFRTNVTCTMKSTFYKPKSQILKYQS